MVSIITNQSTLDPRYNAGGDDMLVHCKFKHGYAGWPSDSGSRELLLNFRCHCVPCASIRVCEIQD